MTSRNQAADDDLPDHLPRWLEAVSRRLRDALAASGLHDFPELRGSHRRILQMIPADGIRITDLARTAGMTKQSLGEFIDWLEARGFVASGKDPADARARLVTRTAAGDTAADTAARAIAVIERDWRAEIGAREYDTMKQALRDLGRDSFRR
jgi:DNA-binding MarR family transcriptional regulator